MPGWTAAAIAGAGALGAGSSLAGAGKSSSAATQAANLQAQRYQQTRADLAPYTQTGVGVLGDLSSLATSGPYGPGGTDYLRMAQQNLPLNMTQAELEKTPGYQFILSQGLKGVQSAAAAKGLGVSGAAMKGAAAYTTGLADQTYQNQFNMAQQRFKDILGLSDTQQGILTNQFNRLNETAKLGENAGAQTGVTGAQLAASQGSMLNQAGQDLAAGTQGVGSAATGATQNYLSYNALQQWLNKQPTPGGSGQIGGYPNATEIQAAGANTGAPWAFTR